ncbi:hypothetical protein ACP4OV_017448 [Aristida adscensionis]
MLGAPVPYLARATGKCVNYGESYTTVHLDAPGDRWVADADTMDVVVHDAGHRVLNGAVYRREDEVVGTHNHPELNHTDIGYATPLWEAYRMSVERLLPSSGGLQRTVVLATYSPTHFDDKAMDNPASCAEERPYGEGERELRATAEELRSIVVEEAAVAARKAAGGGARVEVLDVTKLAAMRPDGHPWPYMHRNPFAHSVLERMPTDCLHFCLPGPVDTFNEILLQILIRRR